MKKIQITGIVGWDATPEKLREELSVANGDHVEIEISSPGGFIAPGLTMFNLIRNYSGTVDVRITGYAMSMASYLPLAVKARKNKGVIRAEDNAVYMIHNARGGVFGDHNDIIAHGEYLRGLSELLSKQYVKHTGKDIDEIKSMMDKETFFFGDEMVNHGFVDEIIETDDDGDSAVALTSAKAVFSDMMVKMSADHDKLRSDFENASALLQEFQPPAAAGSIKKEAEQMKLQELLAANPTAKAEFDAALAAAKSEGGAEAKKQAAEMLEKVGPFLANASYPAVIATTALKVLKGEENIVALTASVAAVDAVRETGKQTAAVGEQGGETPGQQQTVHKPGETVASVSDLEAEIARFKEVN